MAAFVAKQMVGNKLSAVKGKIAKLEEVKEYGEEKGISAGKNRNYSKTQGRPCKLGWLAERTIWLGGSWREMELLFCMFFQAATSEEKKNLHFNSVVGKHQSFRRSSTSSFVPGICFQYVHKFTHSRMSLWRNVLF